MTVPTDFIPAFESCRTEDAKVYAQWTCIQDKATIYAKYYKIANVQIIAIFIALCFLLNLRRIYHKGEKNYTEYNLETVTAGDFTVMWEIDKKTYELWEVFRVRKSKDGFPEFADISEGRCFKDRVKNDVEKLLERFRKYLIKNKETYEGDPKEINISEIEELKEKVCKIADINFAYQNGTLLKLLMKRG